jgi:hypothetical protein
VAVGLGATWMFLAEMLLGLACLGCLLGLGAAISLRNCAVTHDSRFYFSLSIVFAFGIGEACISCVSATFFNKILPISKDNN